MQTLPESESPLIFRNCIRWNIIKWTLDEWKKFFESSNVSKNFTFRQGYQCCSQEPLWERNCETVEMPMTDFFDFSMESSQSNKWLYFDYKHIAEWFDTEDNRLDISWKDFGFPDKTAKDSTIWIGTKYAHTPCHMDTYGFNLVAQIFGQKQWFLFPPSETDNLKPTRVPYEESSVYSSINFACGCADISGIKDVKVVTLNPGDVLFVPFHWWHFVENLSTAVSVNIWLPTTKDDTIRLEESLVKYFISNVCRSVDSVEKILNPNEDDIPTIKEEFNLKEVTWCLDKCKEGEREQPKLLTSEIKFNKQTLPSTSIEDFINILKTKCSGHKKDQPKDDIRNEVINAFCHPDIIALVRAKLLKS